MAGKQNQNLIPDTVFRLLELTYTSLLDEPRRSGRPTKGQHTKTLDLMDQLEPAKKKGGKKAKKPVEEVEEVAEEIIRCVCGARSSPEEDPEPWIACDNCTVWQHNVCVGMPTEDEDLPEDLIYLCEECDPAFHKELLDGLARGVKVWEERRRKYERGLVEEEAPKKKGKKKGKRASDPKVESNGNGKAASPFTPVVADGKKRDVKVTSTKRKARDESHDKEAVKVDFV